MAFGFAVFTFDTKNIGVCTVINIIVLYKLFAIIIKIGEFSGMPSLKE